MQKLVIPSRNCDALYIFSMSSNNHQLIITNGKVTFCDLSLLEEIKKLASFNCGYLQF